VVLVTVLVSTVLLGAAALTVDLGNAYARKRSLQTSADLAALAGVARLPHGIAAARIAVLANLCTDSGTGRPSENTVLGWPDGTCPPDLAGRLGVGGYPMPSWVSDGVLANGEIRFYRETAATGGAEPTFTRVTSDHATALTVVTPAAEVEFGLARAMPDTAENPSPDRVGVQMRASARLVTPRRTGATRVLPFAMTRGELIPGNGGMFCIKDTQANVNTWNINHCDEPYSQRGYLDLPRNDAVDHQVERNISFGTQQMLHDYRTWNSTNSTLPLPPRDADCYAGVGLPGVIPAQVSNSFVSDANCIQLEPGNRSGQLQAGFFNPISGSPPGRMTDTCSHQTYVPRRLRSRGGTPMDATDLFDPANGLVSPSADLALLRHNLAHGIPATPAQRGWITKKVFDCPRFSVLPIVNTSTPPLDGSGSYPVVGHTYAWIANNAGDNRPIWLGTVFFERGFVWRGRALIGVTGFTIDPGYLPETVATPEEGEAWGGAGSVPQAVLIRDIPDQN
jgi:hypothetical protein